MAGPVDITLKVNGTQHKIAGVPEDLPLLSLLQDELGLTGTKLCCGIGQCRACTVAVEDAAGGAPTAMPSCQMPVSTVNGQSITTVEGLAPAGALTALQREFLTGFAFQCGYCTPGFLMEGYALMARLRKAPVAKDKLDAEIADALAPHFCRCTGYKRYFDATKRAILAEGGMVR